MVDSNTVSGVNETVDDSESETVTAADADELLTLLGDDYTMRILSTLGDESLAARQIAERADVSRQTVYRRLNGLESAGIVEARLLIDESGQHRRHFRIAVDELEISFGHERDTRITAGDRTRPD